MPSRYELLTQPRKPVPWTMKVNKTINLMERRNGTDRYRPLSSRLWRGQCNLMDKSIDNATMKNNRGTTERFNCVGA